MEWKAFGHVPYLHYEGTITACAANDVLAALTDVWCHLLTVVMAAYPQHDWDAIECTLWPTSGRLIMYPYKNEERFQRHERVFVQVHIEALEGQYWVFLDALDTEDEPAVDVYNTQTDTLVDQYWALLIEAAGRAPATHLFQQLRQHRSIVVYACEEHPSLADMVRLPI